MRVRLLLLAVLLVAGAVAAFLYFGQNDDEELVAAAGAECQTHAMAEALDEGLLDEFHEARGWHVNGVTRGHVDPAARSGQLYVVSGDLTIKDLSGRVTRENYVCRLELTVQGDWRLLEMGYPSPPER